MGRKGKWFSAVKKAFSPDSKEKKSKENKLQNNYKSSNKLGGIGQYKDSDPSSSESFDNSVPNSAPPPIPQPQIVENEQSKHDYSVLVASSSSAEPQPAAEVARVVPRERFAGKLNEESAAIKIQTAFRGYLARRAVRALRGLVRLKSLIHGTACKRQATTTLRCMQTVARVQSQVRSRRIRMSEENLALQRQLLLKHERELECLRLGEEWDDTLQSKEQTEASLHSKQEAGIRRERALAYAFTHQGKASSRSANAMFMDPNNPQWGWSRLERWTAARPWESRSTADKDLSGDRASVNGASLGLDGGEITKAYANRDNVPNKSTPQSKPPISAGKINSASPKMVRGPPEDDDARSTISMKSDKMRRHSIAGSSVGDDESMASSPAVPSYMAPTRSTRARSRFSSPSSDVVIEGLDKVSAKKKLSYPAAPRRHSGPPKVNMAKVKDVAVSVGGECE